MEQNYSQLPENIRLNLKKYEKHRHVTCLECGYDGLMGINNPNYSGVIFWILLFGVAMFLTTLGINFFIIFFVALFAVLIKNSLFGDKVVCPNCEKDLVAK